MNDKDYVRDRIRKLLTIVDELEQRFPGRKFTLDGHLLGSIGEVLAEYYYGIRLYPNNTKTHDGEVEGKKVQIKVTQGSSVDINDIPDFLLVLYLSRREGEVYEVYNGSCEWLKSCRRTKNGWFNRSLKKLSQLNYQVDDNERIRELKVIKKWNPDI